MVNMVLKVKLKIFLTLYMGVSLLTFGGGDVAVEYCARHRRWESISVRWTKNGFLKFSVRRHKKDHRW